MFWAALLLLEFLVELYNVTKKYVFQALSFYLTLKKIITFSNWFAINQKKTFPHKGSDKTCISQACTHFMPISYSAKDIKCAKTTIANNFWY